MKTLANLLPSAFIHTWGWTLLHFVWQGLLIALGYALSLQLLKRRPANQRYLAGCVALLFVALMPVFTYFYLALNTHSLADHPTPVVSSTSFSLTRPQSSRTESFIRAKPPGQAPAANSAPALVDLKETLTILLPSLVYGWGLGVLFLSNRWLAGGLKVLRLKRGLTKPMEEAWGLKLRVLMERMAMSRTVKLIESAWVEVPTVIGYFRPLIVIPASALTGLTSGQLELLLAHELAHIRRHDYLVNTLQNLVEVLMFYHPAVWWVSRNLRQEREHCCDDVAVETCGNRLEYVRALATLEEQRGLTPAWTVGANGGSLLQRVRRLAHPDEAIPAPGNWWLPGITVLMVCLSLILGSREAAVARDNAGSGSAATVSPSSKTLKNGATVEFIGVSYDPFKQGQPWWTPDGRRLIEAPYDQFIGVFEYGDPHVPRQFAFRVQASNAEYSYEITPEPGTSGSSTVSALKNGRPLQDIFLIHADFPDQQKTGNVRLGIAAGPWLTRMTPGLEAGSSSRSDFELLSSHSLEVDGHTTVTITVARCKLQSRFLALDAQGREHEPAKTLGSTGAGEMKQTTYQFDLPLKQIRHYLFQTRAYEWIEFNEVALNPPTGSSTASQQAEVQPTATAETNSQRPKTDARLQFRLVVGDDVKAQISALETDLAGLRDRYQDTHPQVRAKLKELEDFEKSYERYADPQRPNFSVWVSREILLTESAIASAMVERHPVSNEPEIRFALTDRGTATFDHLTETNIGRQLAIIFDGRLLSAPRIMSRIPGGKGAISGNFALAEAEAIATALNKKHD